MVDHPESHARPLAGFRVIDFTHVLAGPACAYYLGLLGADVIKLESVGRGDAIRHRGGSDSGLGAVAMSTSYLTQGGGKRSIALDIQSPGGREAFEELIKWADVFIENHRPATGEALGITYEDTRAINPKLVHCVMTGYGRGGPKAEHSAYDVNIQATCGIMAITGTQETGPVRPGAPIMDYGTGLSGALGVTAALLGRVRTDDGAFVDVSMLETAFTLMGSTVCDYLTTGNEPRPRGNAANSRSPGAGSFDTRSGMISLGVNEEGQFDALAQALGCAQWLDDERFNTRAGRTENRDLVEASLVVALAEKTAGQWEQILGDAGVPCAQVRTLPQMLDHPQVAARGFVHEYSEVPGVDRVVSVPTLPFKIGATQRTPASPPPVRAQHTREILAELGFDEKAIVGLIERGCAEQA